MWLSKPVHRYYRANVTSSNQLTFVTNPHGYPLRDGDLVYVDTSHSSLPIVAHSISPMCCQVQLLINEEE